MEGHRYAARPAHRDAAVTVLAVEALEELAAALGSEPFDPALARRNVVLRGAEVEALRGVPFTLDRRRRTGPSRWRASGQSVLRSPGPLDPGRAGTAVRPLPARVRAGG